MAKLIFLLLNYVTYLSVDCVIAANDSYLSIIRAHELDNSHFIWTSDSGEFNENTYVMKDNSYLIECAEKSSIDSNAPKDVRQRISNASCIIKTVQFYLTNVTIEDAGEYKLGTSDALGDKCETCFLVISLFIYGKPTEPVILQNKSHVTCTSESTSRPHHLATTMTYNLTINDVIHVRDGSAASWEITITDMVNVSCVAFENGSKIYSVTSTSFDIQEVGDSLNSTKTNITDDGDLNRWDLTLMVWIEKHILWIVLTAVALIIIILVIVMIIKKCGAKNPEPSLPPTGEATPVIIAESGNDYWGETELVENIMFEEYMDKPTYNLATQFQGDEPGDLYSEVRKIRPGEFTLLRA